MLTAVINNQPINLVECDYPLETIKKWSNKNIIKCPVCGGSYELCAGQVMILYFRHKDKKQCENYYSEPETQEHLLGKEKLYKWLCKIPGVQNITLEDWIPETRQRPDISFNYHNQKYVLEYQCSPIATEFIERHDLYEAAGIKDIWICGAENYFQYYHTGRGNKKSGVLEQKSKIYFDPQAGNIFRLYSINPKFFNQIINGNSYLHLMNDPTDYKNNKENAYLVKVPNASFVSSSFYPSGRPTNKNPYPITEYTWDRNLSLAKCTRLEDANMKHII